MKKILVLMIFLCLGNSTISSAQWNDNNNYGVLDEELIQDYEAYCSGLLQITLNTAQKQQFKAFTKANWDQNNQERIREISQSLSEYQQLLQLPTAERTQIFRALTPHVVANVKKAADQGAEDSRWILDIYYQQHPVIIPGNPPLTQHMIDLALDFQYFFSTSLKGISAPPMTIQERNQWTQSLTTEYKNASAENQFQLSIHLSESALMMYRWSKMSAEERLMIRAHLGEAGNLSPEEQMQVQYIQQQMLAGINTQNFQLLQNELNFMRQSQSTIMGEGTYYNQTLGRWEQKGGIVTEFH